MTHQRHRLGQVLEARRRDVLVQRSPGAGADRPAAPGQQVQHAAAQAAGRDGRMQAARGECQPRGLGGLGQLPFFPLARLAPLYQPRTARADRVHLGPVRQDEEEAPLDPRPGAQAPVHGLYTRGAQEHDVDPKGGETLQPAAHGSGSGRAGTRDGVPTEAHHGKGSVDLLEGIQGRVHAAILPQACAAVRRAP